MKNFQIIILLFSIIIIQCLIQVKTQQEIGIGVLLAEEQSSIIVPLGSAIFTKNSLQSVFKYKIHSQIIPEADSFKASKILCNLTQNGEGIAAVFGPMKRVMTLPIIQSVCENLEIPHVQINWRPSATFSNVSTILNLYPEPGLLAQGYATIVKNLGWKSFVLLYENDDGLIRLQDALKIQEYIEGNNKNSVIVRQLGPGPDYRPLLKEIKNSTESNIILDCETDHVAEILLQAEEMKLMESHHRYLLTTLDAHTVNLNQFHTLANITTVRIMDVGNENFLSAVSDWRQYATKEPFKSNWEWEISKEFSDPYLIKTESVLIYDAIKMFIETLQELQGTDPITTDALYCSSNKKWKDGYRISSYMQTKGNEHAISGPINFDAFGRRVNFTLFIYEGNRDKCIAKWYPDTPNVLNFTRSELEREEDLAKSLEGSKLIVSSRIGAPYLRVVEPEDGKILIGNQRYEGYSMDLIAAIAKIHKFDFEFRLTRDNAYGSLNENTGKWNGLIRDLLEREADLAICDLTITHARREAVDFSLPFMTLGISILYKKPEAEEIDMFAFLKPFSVEVWIYTATLYLAISVILYFVSRMAPADWENPHPCDENPEELENIWDIKNCFWLTLGSIMAQGCDILPKGISSRMATSMWWFFSLIMMSSYTANLAAFLTTERMEGSINSAEDLVKQTKIKYGTVRGGATQAFFRDSNFTTFQRMWTNMKTSKPEVFEDSNADGVKRVKTTKNRLYAFLMESTQIEFEIETECELKQVGGRLDSKNYGIAMRPGFQYRNMINAAILQLQENGQLAALKRKWWKEKRANKSCSEQETAPEQSSAELALANVGGVFIVLGVGVGIAFLLGALEFLWNVRNISVEEHISYLDALKIELIFALNIWVTKKRAKPDISESTSNQSEGDAKSIVHSILHGAGSFLNLADIKNKE